jgi:hypothetical protein
MFLLEALFELIGEFVVEALFEGIAWVMAGAYHRVVDLFTTLFS